jgi:hypothetical protein
MTANAMTELKANGEPRVKDSPGAPKMSERGKITGYNLLEGSKKRNAQMKFLLKNMREPDLGMMQDPTSVRSLASEFDLEEIKEEEWFNSQGITFRILNSQGFGRGRHDTDNDPTYMSVAIFMNSIQDYLPESLRAKRDGYQLWKRQSFVQTNTFSDETRELLDQMVNWLIMMRDKIEDQLTSKYYITGKNHQLEMLKRRYKDHWSEKVEQEVVADVNQDTTVNVILEDFDDEH